MDKNFIVSEINRLDKFLASQIDASRNQIEQLIKKEYVNKSILFLSNFTKSSFLYIYISL